MDTPCVVIDHNAKTAIVTRQGRKFFYLVPMQSGRLTVKKLTKQQLENKRIKQVDVDIHQAVDAFLRHSGGLTKLAEKELNEVKGAN